MAEAAIKPEKDFSKEAEKQIGEAEKLAKSNLNGAIEKLTVLEKQTRQVSLLPTSFTQVQVILLLIHPSATGLRSRVNISGPNCYRLDM